MTFQKFIKKHQFKILVVGSVLVILILYLLKDDNEEGTWSLSYFYDPQKKKVHYVKESKGEIECRRVLEHLFLKPFPNQRPLFLTNSVTGKPLELDCYNAEIGLAVEYNGRQHYSYTPGMHKSYDAFRTQQYRDDMKRRMCKENNVILIEVPYSIKVESIENYLHDKLREQGYKIDF
jgi:hypothetical protein